MKYSLFLLRYNEFFFFFKIDLKNADPERVVKQIEKVFDIPSDECIKVKYL